MKLRNVVRYWWPPILWAALVLLASTDLMSAEHTSRFLVPFLEWITPEISPAGIASVQLFVRKMAHLVEYALLAALLMRALRAGGDRLKLRHVGITLVLALTCASSDEFHQSLVASRTGSVSDVMIDIVGAAIGVALYSWFVRGRFRRSSSSAAEAPMRAEQ